MTTKFDIDNVSCPECNLRNRHEIAQDYYTSFVNRLNTMFKWTGLPETIPETILERYLQLNGWCGIGEATVQSTGKTGLYCFFGGLGAVPDEYYRPTEIILANPILGSKTYKIGKDVVWAKNDSLSRGISQLLARYAHMLAANDISINIAQVTSRMPFMITADTDAQVESAQKFVKDAEDGKIGIVKSSSFNAGVEPKPTEQANAGNYLKSLIELHQYLKAQWANDFGIGSNFNMKRERMSEAEVESNSPYLLPLVDEMLKFRRKICDDVHEMFPEQNWTVELDSAWKLENDTQELQVEQMESEISSQLNSNESEVVEDVDLP